MEEAEARPKGRRRPPSPAAKRVMILSAVASIGLAVVLSVVFLPRLFEQEALPKDPFYTLVGETTGSVTTISVETASFPRPFEELGLILFNGSRQYEGALDPAVPIGPVSYKDANGDAILNVGDFFRVQVESGRQYILLITLLEDPGGGGVGRYAWAAP